VLVCDRLAAVSRLGGHGTIIQPRARADVIIDNRDFTRPAIIGPPSGR